MKIDFIIAGAAKSGSTSLIQYLDQSPDISCLVTLSDGNEINFFSKDRIYKKGLKWYESLFAHLDTDKIIGEKSASYMSSEAAPERIFKAIPGVRLIFILRNPVDRAYSHYRSNIQKGTEFFSFEKALKAEAKRIKRGGFFRNNYSYKQRSMYYDQISRFLNYFPREQMHFLLLEELNADPAKELAKICEFLNVDKAFIDTVDLKKRYNPTKVSKIPLIQFLLLMCRRFIRIKIVMRIIDRLRQINLKDVEKPPMKTETRRVLMDYFKESNQKLGKLIGKDLSIWDSWI